MSSKIETVQTPRRLLDVLRFWLERANERSESGDIAELVELRALLAKPAPTADFNCVNGGKCGNGGYCDACPYVEPSAQHQGETVALQHMAVSEGGVLRWMTGRKIQDCELYTMPDGSAIRSKLYTSPPAPVAVVLPERRREPTEDSDVLIDCHNEGWNACLDEVARLNTK